jgi:hypothetical protein
VKLAVKIVFRATVSVLIPVLVACGGGNGGSSTTNPPPPLPLTITNDQILPGTLYSHNYSATLQAINATSSLTWSIAPVSPTALFVDGLSIDAQTGVLSGTVNFEGTAGFIATVKETGSQRTATKGFYLTAYSPMQTPSPQTFTFGQYADPAYYGLNISGGVQPLTYTVTGGSMPRGLRLDSQLGVLSGSAITAGTTSLAVTITDSFSPPEVVTAQVTIQVQAPALNVFSNSIVRQIPLNRPVSGRLVVDGGTAPYQFTMTSGSMPPGVSAFDSGTGQFHGTPTKTGYFFGSVTVTDSSSPAQVANADFGITVANPLGRNDTIATATAIDNGTISASISPYIDPPSSAPLPNDNDYYKLVSVSGATVHIETFAQRAWSLNPLDTVIEILDSSGTRLTTCRQSGDGSNNFTSACVNDDIPSLATTDSALDFKVPGAASTPTTFYAHVLDFRGSARPDMLYQLAVSGVVDPLLISPNPVLPASKGIAYSYQLTSSNGAGAVTWSLAGGNLPPGLGIGASGAITGTATTNGTYSFTVKATDSSTPPQIATADEHIQVVDPVQITSPANWPDACVNRQYSFAVQISGGLAPFQWSFISSSWVGINLDQSTGIFSGYSSVTGTFNGTVGVFDATQRSVGQNITLKVKNCPTGETILPLDSKEKSH